MSQPKDYDSTLARMAGNIAAGLVNHPEFGPYNWNTASKAVELAGEIISICRDQQKRAAGTERTDPA